MESFGWSDPGYPKPPPIRWVSIANVWCKFANFPNTYLTRVRAKKWLVVRIRPYRLRFGHQDNSGPQIDLSNRGLERLDLTGSTRALSTTDPIDKKKRKQKKFYKYVTHGGFCSTDTKRTQVERLDPVDWKVLGGLTRVIPNHPPFGGSP